MYGSNKYLTPLFFYFPYNPVSYFKSKYHSNPLRYSVSIEVINFDYNFLRRLM